MAGMTPSQRTLNYLRERGYLAETVERWLHHAKVRKDLYKFCDVLGVHPSLGHLYVQATTASHSNARLHKMLLFAEDEIEIVLDAGAKVEIHGWRQLKGRGRQKWFPKIISVTKRVLHKMDDAQWQVAREFMGDVWQKVEGTTAEDGDLKARVELLDYPPAINIVVELAAGSASEQADRFMPKELKRASELAVQLAEPALASWPELALKKARHLGKWQLGYVLRPEAYELVPGVKDVK
jgi:hypothetical protein